MIGIIAVNNTGYIGKDNKLMWHSTADLQHFKGIRQGRKMFVGYNTFEGLPSFLKDLVNNDQKLIVDERNKLFLEPDGIQYLCIGGKKTYEKYCHLFTELHISHINDNGIGDCTFPDLRNMPKECKVFNYHFEVNQ